jgi:hypothetical protein
VADDVVERALGEGHVVERRPDEGHVREASALGHEARFGDLPLGTIDAEERRPRQARRHRQEIASATAPELEHARLCHGRRPQRERRADAATRPGCVSA